MKTIYDVAERLNKDPNDVKGRKTLARMLGGYCALRLDDAGKILASETEAAIEYCEDSGDDAPKAITFAEWEKRSLKQREACPVTRRALLNGELRIERNHGLPAVLVDWGPISIPLREVAAYRAEADGFADPAAAVAALSGALPTDWAWAQRDWLDLLSLPKPNPQQRSLVDRVRERLVFRREEHRDRTSAEVVIDPRPEVSYTNSAPVPPMTDAPPLIAVLAAPKDDSYRAALIRHLIPIVRQGLVQVWDGLIPPGAVTARYREERIRAASIVLHLCSPDFEVDCFDISRWAFLNVPAARHIPTLIRPGGVPSHLIAGVPLPRNGKPLSQWGDKDEAWCEIIAALRGVLKLLSR